MSQGRVPTVNPLNSTALKWGSDGELSALDQQRILQLLCRVDPVAESLISGLADGTGEQPLSEGRA